MVRRVISHYELQTSLGQGGMGEVYVGLDLTLQRKVALKVVRRERRLDATARARLLREARILSQLDHPNICRVYDYIEDDEGGFLVMELIDGKSLRAALGAGFSPSLRLPIAEQIAAALVAAHAAGVVHRDLKPENVMLEAGGGVKVLDFGIARSIETPAADDAVEPVVSIVSAPIGDMDETRIAETFAAPQPRSSGALPAFTSPGAILGTTIYMSPEQAAGDVVGAPSDMYAFGLLLQEIYTGRRPYEGSDAAGLLQRIRKGESEPVTNVDRDIAALIDRLKALAPTLRPTAADVVERLRFIREKPWRRRRRLGAAAAVLVAVGGAAKYTVDVTRERTAAVAAREDADRRREQAEGLIGFMLGDLRTRLQRVGRLDVLDEVGKRAMTYFAALPESAITDEELFRRSQAVHQIGQVRMAQGNMKAAEESFIESLRLATVLAARDSANGEWQIALATSHFYAGEAKRRHSDFQGALVHFEEYRNIARALVERAPEDSTYLLELSYGHSNVAGALEALGDLEGARRELALSLALKEKLAARDPGRTEVTIAVARGHGRLALVAEQNGEAELALKHHTQALDLWRRLSSADSDDPELEGEVAEALGYVGLLLQDQGITDDALKLSRERVAITARLVERDAANLEWQREQARAEQVLGVLVERLGRPDEAERRLERANAIFRSLAARESTLYRRRQLDAALSEVDLASLRVARRRLDDATALANAALGRLNTLLTRDPNDTEARRGLANAYLTLGTIAQLGSRSAQGFHQQAFDVLAHAARSRGERRLQATWAEVLIAMSQLDQAAAVMKTLAGTGFRSPGLETRWARAAAGRGTSGG